MVSCITDLIQQNGWQRKRMLRSGLEPGLSEMLPADVIDSCSNPSFQCPFSSVFNSANTTPSTWSCAIFQVPVHFIYSYLQATKCTHHIAHWLHGRNHEPSWPHTAWLCCYVNPTLWAIELRAHCTFLTCRSEQYIFQYTWSEIAAGHLAQTSCMLLLTSSLFGA